LPYAPLMTRGSQPTDGGNLLLNLEEKNELEKMNPIAKEFIRPFAMGDEFINNTPRFCLWLVDIAPSQLKQMPLVIQRIEKVKMMRLASTKASTKKWADRAHLFTENRQPTTSYLALPRVSSERRIYVPIGFLGADF